MQGVGVFREGTEGSVCDSAIVKGDRMYVVFRVGAHTLYQVPSITFLVLVPLRNPRVRGRPTATTGFLGMSRRNPGRLDDMMEAKGQEGKEGRTPRYGQ